MMWLHDLSAWLVVPAMFILFVGISLVGLIMARRWSRRSGLCTLVDNGVVGWLFSAILGIYSIAIGLVAVASWSKAAEASQVASNEAAELAALYRDLGGYAEPLQGQLKALLTRYTRYVIDEAWPLQRRGQIPHGGTEILHDFQHLLFDFEPALERQKILHAETLHAFNTLIEFRRLRLEAVSYAVPGTLWCVVLIGALLAIGSSYVFSIESLLVHVTMTGLLAAMIALLVYFIAINDYPYLGAKGVGPEAYELVLHDLVARPATP